MTKRLLSALLAVVMVMSMLVFPTYAEEETQTTEVGYCQHCKTVVPEEQWLPWDTTNVGPRTGHYYLANDIADQEKQITINLDDDLARNKICLDLRGRSYTVTGLRPFLIYGIFSIMDSVGNGEIVVTGANNANGAFAQMGKKDGCIDGAGELNVYGGTIRRVSDDAYTVAYGGLIYIATGATLNVYGGKLIGGEVKPKLTSENKKVAPMGGTIYCTASYINLYGGVVTGGISKDGSLTVDGTTTSYEATGGNIYAQSKSVITIDGGTLENGYSETYGGNITFKDSTLNLKSGEVVGGFSEGAAGNLYATGTATLNISGGVLKNGVCKTRGGNLFVNNANVTVNISGGEIYGDLSVGVFKSMTLSGAPKIYMGLGNGLRLQSTNEAKIDVSGLTQGAEIYLDGVDQTFTGALENGETILSYFKDAIRADITLTENNELQVAQGSTGYCPHCWESGAEATWEEWDNGSATTTSVTNKTATGHYYFTANYTKKGLFSIGTKDVKNNDVVIDMASKSLTVTDKKAFNLYSNLSLMDSVGGGYITSTGHGGANGGVIMGTASGKFNMYSGTLSRTVKSGEEHKNVLLGGILYAPSGSVTNIYGGIIRDGISAASSDGTNYPKGGNIDAMGEFNMTAGALIGGKAYTTTYKNNNTENPILDKNGKIVVAYGYGGNLFLGGTANITGGHIVGGNATQGGNIHITTGAEVTITDASIRDGVANETEGLIDATVDLGMRGGNIFITGTTSKPQDVTLTDTLMVNGTSREHGGNIYVTYGKLTLNDTLLTGGIAGVETGDDGRGGNLYISSSGKCDMHDSILGNGYALGHGGNVFGPGGVDMRLYSGIISGGRTKNYGGNLYCSGLTMYGGVVTGGTSTNSNGGNIFVYETTIEEGKEPAYNYLHIEATEGKPAPIISNGTSSSMGGNITIGKNSKATIIGAIIEDGNGDTGNKTGSVNGDNLYGRTGTVMSLEDTQIRGIKANGNAGNGIYAEGELILKGNTVVTNEEKDDCVRLTEGKLTVDASFCGEVAISFADYHYADANEPQGSTLAEQNTTNGLFTGKLYLDGHKDVDYGLPAIFAEEGSNLLHVAAIAVIDPVEDAVTWYRDINTAAANTAENAYLKLYKAENAAQITKDIAIDLNGKNLAVTGNGTVYGFDSKNDTYETFGNMTVGEGVEYTSVHTAPNGRRYIALETETGVSFHRLGLAITGVSLRPSAAGVYYKATWECDDLLKESIESFGIAVSTENMPGLDFATDADTLYTTVAKENFVSGQAVTGALISNIIKTGDDNQTRGNMPIYAAPYAVINGNTVIGDDNAPTMGGVIYSMKTVLQSIDRAWHKLASTQKDGIRALYALDSEVMATWDLYNITAAIEGTPAIRPLKVLTLGHSLAVDSGHMLNLVADAEGYDQPMEIATLYYSGCPLYKHVNYIKNNSAVYDLYVSSTTTPGKAPVITKSVTMEYGVKYMDWDIIIMQGGVFEIAYDDKYQDGNIQFIQNYVDSIKTNPNAIYAWHMAWACPTDNELRDKYPYSPNSYYTSYEAFNDDRTTMYNAITGAVSRNIVTDDSFLYLIPSGTAIENALSSYLVEKDLHRDYVHVSDLGRVIASYTWYCTLAGIDHLEEIQLDAIPKAFLKSTSDKTQDRVLTEAEKAIVLESVNNALANPLQMTQSQYTVAP
ncbi:MAG: DUF4886 domain-containing protein [Oscillospiraceae bacterium]|nr:DUF4886 domain-containing protein [Oscillospiraceae bacterium]